MFADVQAGYHTVSIFRAPTSWGLMTADGNEEGWFYNEATDTVEGAKNQLVAVGIGVALVLLLLSFFLGRRGGVRKSTIIEVKRA